jgi:hypothetical protein
MAYEDSIGQIICRGDTVTVLNPVAAAAAAAANGNHCGVVLWKGRPGPNKVLVRRLNGSKMTAGASLGPCGLCDRTGLLKIMSPKIH